MAIGDVHGNLTNLVKLWKQLETEVSDFASTHVVFLGDLVDRGAEVRDTIEWCIQLKRSRPSTVHFLSGNHDAALTAYLQLPPFGNKDYRFQRGSNSNNLLNEHLLQDTHLQGVRYTIPGHYNADSTFRSYGVEFPDRDALLAVMPQDHKEFLSSLQFVIEHENYIFVHAGLRTYAVGEWAGMSLLEQVARLRNPVEVAAMSWLEPISNRNFHDGQELPELHGRVVVCGHIATPVVSIEKSVIRVDTSGGAPARPLSAISLPDKRVFQSHERERF